MGGGETSRKIFCIIIFLEKTTGSFQIHVLDLVFSLFFSLCLIYTLNNVCYLVCNVQCIRVHLFSKGNPVSLHLFSI